MKYKYFLFDWDGSLANTLPIWFAGYKKVFGQFGIKVDNETIAREVLGDWQGPARLGIQNDEAFFAELEKEVLDKVTAAELNPGVLEMVKLIKEKGGRVGVITASKKRWVKTALKRNLSGFVDVFLGKEDVVEVKPDPEALIKTLKYMGGRAEESVMIGDNGKDIQAAKRAGTDSCLYFPERYKEFYKKEVQMAWGQTRTITDFKELRELI